MAIVRESDRPLIFRFYFKHKPLRLFGNEFREAVCPFDHRDAVAVKVIIEAKSRDGLSIFHAKKIEVIHRQSPSSIFMQDGEGRTRHIDAATQPGDETFDEQRFTAPQISLESQNQSGMNMLRKSTPDCLSINRTVGNERSHAGEVDCL